MFYREGEVIVNPDDINGAWWPNLYAVNLDAIGDTFIVCADAEQYAFDEIADYCVERGWMGYIATGEEFNDAEWQEEYFPAGNGDTYIRDNGNTRIVQLARRVGYGSEWSFSVEPVCDTVTLPS